jgi:diguanylate cyclase (GGDEF)-like protein
MPDSHSAPLFDPQLVDILVVDDKPHNLRLLSTLLEREGYSVRKALDGEMALTAMHTLRPDIVLLDIMMPGIDGYEVCRRLKNNPKTCETPVIFLTALNEAFDKVKAFDVGGSDYITKPFQIEEVLVRIRNQVMLRVSEERMRALNATLEARVTERTQQLRMVNQQLLYMALHDLLTGLPNRALFMQELQQALDGNLEEDPFAVLFLDCDRFKVVNDSLGHGFGDAVLIHLSERLQSTLEPGDLLARLGGDEFAVLLPKVRSAEVAIAKTDALLQSFAQPFQIEGREIFLNASVGIVLSHTSYTKPEYILRDADTAMYRAKASKVHQYHVFDASMHQAAVQRLQLEVDLRRAIEGETLSLYYQPIVCLKTGVIKGVEALVRWPHDQLGLISPEHFIPVAEETGLIHALGEWVLRQGCRQLKQWQSDRLVNDQFVMSLNLSVQQFHDPHLIHHIDAILAETQINPKNLDLEITESVIMDGLMPAMSLLRQIKERQILLSLDDFGTGFSSLSYLHSFPFDVLKIDKSFVRRLDHQADDAANLVPAIMAIARTLDIRVIAEGIESVHQFQELQQLNCALGQGYLFAKPMEPQTLQPLLGISLFNHVVTSAAASYPDPSRCSSHARPTGC